MLKQRITATLIIKDGIVVQSIGFNKYLPIGKPKIAVEYLNKWGIDEIIILDIDASKNKTSIDSNLIKEVSSVCFAPICAGGGISSVKDINELLRSGADKVSINHNFLHNPDFIYKAVETFGSQCIVVALDVKKENDIYMVYDATSAKTLNTLEHYLEQLRKYNIGELLINNVDADGKKIGLDTKLIDFVLERSTLPVIALGGASGPQDLKEAIKNPNLSAVSAANFFHYFEHSVNITKSFLKHDINYPIRLDNFTSYKGFEFTKEGKTKRHSDEKLAQLLFEIPQEEKI
jgi:cyclase